MEKTYIIVILFLLITHISFAQETTLELLSNFHGYGEIKTLDVENNYMYLVAGDYLLVYDISTPGIYSFLGERFYSSNHNTRPTQIKVEGNYLYSNNGSWGILTFDVSNPDSILQKSQHYPSITNIGQGFSINENIIAMHQIVGYGGSSVLLGDLSGPLNILDKGQYNIPFYSESFLTAIKNNHLFITAQKYYEFSYLGADMIIVDISDLNNPVQTFRLHSGFRELDLQDNYLFTADTTNTLKIFDISEINNAVLVNEVPFITRLPFPNTYFSTNNYHLVTSEPPSGGNQKFILYNTSSVTNIILNDTLNLNYGNNYYVPNVFGDQLFLRRSGDLTIYDLKNEKFEYNKKIIFPGDFTAKDVLTEGDFAYLLGDLGLYIFNISNPASPNLNAFLQLRDASSFSNIYRISLQGNYIFVSGSEDIIICDVSDPYNPFMKGSIEKAGIAYDLRVRGDFAYLTSLGESSLPPYNAFKGFEIIDVSDKANPQQISFTDLGEDALGIAIDSDYAFILTKHSDSPQIYSTNIYTYDISNPDNPLELSVKNFPFVSSRITVSNNFAYLSTKNGLKILDISNITDPLLIGSFGTNLNVRDVFFKDDTLFLAADYDGLYVVDATNKTNPVQVLSYDTEDRAQGVNMQNDNIFVVSGVSGMYALKLNSVNNGQNGDDGGDDDGNNDSLLTPTEFTVLQNFPNPFNRGTKIRYYLPEDGTVKIDLFDILGNKVAVLVNSVKPEGWNTLYYDPKGLSSGVFLLRAESTNRVEVKKLLYLK